MKTAGEIRISSASLLMVDKNVLVSGFMSAMFSGSIGT